MGFGIQSLGFYILEFENSGLGLGNLKLVILFMGLRTWDLDVRILGFEFFSLGIQFWDFVLGFEVCYLEFGILEFGTSILGFWVLHLVFGVCDIQFWSLRIFFFLFFALGFGVWYYGFGVRSLEF